MKKKNCEDQFNTPRCTRLSLYTVFVYFDQYSKLHNEYPTHMSTHMSNHM
jgi:hypothetical protein